MQPQQRWHQQQFASQNACFRWFSFPCVSSPHAPSSSRAQTHNSPSCRQHCSTAALQHCTGQRATGNGQRATAMVHCMALQKTVCTQIDGDALAAACVSALPSLGYLQKCTDKPKLCQTLSQTHGGNMAVVTQQASSQDSVLPRGRKRLCGPRVPESKYVCRAHDQ